MFWFRCPRCGEARHVTADQADARERATCGCGYGRIGLVRPLIPATAPLPHAVAFDVERDRRRKRPQP